MFFESTIHNFPKFLSVFWFDCYPHPLMRRNEDPEQWVGIGFAKGELVSVVHEFREDSFGEFIWLVTYWKATKEEAKT